MHDPMVLVWEKLREAGLNPTGKPDYFKARCPVHEERTPSLWVKVSKCGRFALVTCFGCGASGKEVAESLGISLGQLYFDYNDPRYKSKKLIQRPKRRRPRNECKQCGHKGRLEDGLCLYHQPGGNVFELRDQGILKDPLLRVDTYGGDRCPPEEDRTLYRMEPKQLKLEPDTESYEPTEDEWKAAYESFEW